MSQNANTDKPQLTLIKRKIPLSKRVSDEFGFDFEFGTDADLAYPADFIKNQTNQTNSEATFSELLKAQSLLIQRINYFADELEFNLD